MKSINQINHSTNITTYLAILLEAFDFLAFASLIGGTIKSDHIEVVVITGPVDVHCFARLSKKG